MAFQGWQLCTSQSLSKKLLISPGPALNFVPCRNNWRKNLAKREAKKKDVREYVGENATNTSLIYAWGAAASGALGIASYLRPDVRFKNPQTTINKINRPARVRFYDVHRLKPLDVACGYGFTITSVRYQNKTLLLGTGINTDSQIGYHESPKGSGRVLDQLIEPGRIRLPLQHPDQCHVTSMSCGRAHTAVVVEGEGVFTLGNNAYGQCGRSVVAHEQYGKSLKVNRLEDLPDGGDQVVQVVCGQDHTLFLTAGGRVYSCGMGADGQTGLGHEGTTARPSLVTGDLQGETIVAVAARADTSLAVSQRGELFGWGSSEYGQLGLVTDKAQVSVARRLPVGDCGKVVKAVAGGSVCALLNDRGHVYVWGYGILGKGPALESTATPTQIPEPIFGRNELCPDTRVVDLECGLTYLAARTDRGDVYTWGRNLQGCLGLGQDKNQFFPSRLSLPATAHKMACGPDHMVALCRSFT